MWAQAQPLWIPINQRRRSTFLGLAFQLYDLTWAKCPLLSPDSHLLLFPSHPEVHTAVVSQFYDGAGETWLMRADDRGSQFCHSAVNTAIIKKLNDINWQLNQLKEIVNADSSLMAFQVFCPLYSSLCSARYLHGSEITSLVSNQPTHRNWQVF